MPRLSGHTLGENLNPYPANLRKQLFPLCCGMSVVSGFKDAHTKTEEGLASELLEVCKDIPYNQVYTGEGINPENTMICLNADQMASPKVVKAVKAAGFRPFGECQGMSWLTFWIKSDSWKNIAA